jgi:hypothetical protein
LPSRKFGTPTNRKRLALFRIFTPELSYDFSLPPFRPYFPFFSPLFVQRKPSPTTMRKINNQSAAPFSYFHNFRTGPFVPREGSTIFWDTAPKSGSVVRGPLSRRRRRGPSRDGFASTNQKIDKPYFFIGPSSTAPFLAWYLWNSPTTFLCRHGS